MAVEFQQTSNPTAEWFDTVQPGVFSMSLPEANEDFVFAAARLVSWYPAINSKGATYESEDFDDSLVRTLVNTLANLRHDKSQVIGTVIDAAKTEQGIDIIVQIDRDAAEAQGMDIADMRAGNYFSHVSMEMTRDPAQSWFYAIDDQFNILKRIPVKVGRSVGIRRTTEIDPFLYQGNRVVERLKPKRFTGVGFVPNPADTGAELYAVAASDDTEDKLKRTAVTADEQTQASTDADTPSKEESYMSEADAQALREKVSQLETEVETLKTEKEQASASVNSEVADLKEKLAAKETELASATTELTALRTEKETAARESAIDKIVADLEAIKPCADDTERAALRETAAAACGDDGVVRTLHLHRENEALKEKVAALEAAKPAEAADPKAGDKPADDKPADDKETASTDTFTANPPAQSLAPRFSTGVTKGTTATELDAIF